eukprot:2230228-Rhodomonas_salina.1
MSAGVSHTRRCGPILRTECSASQAQVIIRLPVTRTRSTRAIMIMVCLRVTRSCRSQAEGGAPLAATGRAPGPGSWWVRVTVDRGQC